MKLFIYDMHIFQDLYSWAFLKKCGQGRMYIYGRSWQEVENDPRFQVIFCPDISVIFWIFRRWLTTLSSDFWKLHQWTKHFIWNLNKVRKNMSKNVETQYKNNTIAQFVQQVIVIVIFTKDLIYFMWLCHRWWFGSVYQEY